MTENYAGPNRRTDQTLEILREMREWFENHEKEEHLKFESLRLELQRTREESELQSKELVKRLESLSSSTLAVIEKQNQTLREMHRTFEAAFPDGDIQEHRKAHEAWIAKTKAEQEFLKHLKMQVVSWGLLALFGWVGIALWAAFLRGPTGG